MILTQTNIKDWQTCPLFYKYSQIDGYVWKKTGILIKSGEVFHSAMEIYGEHGKEDALGFLRQVTNQHFNRHRNDPSFKPQKLEEAKACLLGQVEGYPYPVDADNVEHQFEMPFRGFTLAGKWDGKHRRNLREVIFDYKTKGVIPKYDLDLLKRDVQGQLYFYVARRLGHKVEGFELIIVKRTALRQGKKESRPGYLHRIRQDYSVPKRRVDYYARHAIYYDLDDGPFFANLRLIIDDIKRAMDTDRWVKNEANCKNRWHKHCVYLPICNEELGWEELYDVMGADHHPELKFGEEGGNEQ